MRLYADPTFDWRGIVDITIFAFAMAAVFLFFPIKYLLKKELFCYTHYPQRFNRRTRKVHVFRLDGTVMTEDWDKLYFTTGKGDNFYTDMRGHRLAEDGVTVLETFSLANYDSRRDELLKQWEMIRRYMENGPKELMPVIDMVNDMDPQKWTYWACFKAYMQVCLGVSFMAPVALLYGFFRWLALKTSKFPFWPEEIEAQCQVDPDDPYIRDMQHLAPMRDFSKGGLPATEEQA